jgi:hypothetical protein
MFVCGYRMCELSTQVCNYGFNDGFASVWYCDSLPPSCVGDYTCDCVLPYYSSVRNSMSGTGVIDA